MQTIVVIDDDESLRDTIGVLLEQEGFRAVLEADGHSGYESAIKNRPDLIIVDLRLPGMSGTEICKQLRAAEVKTPIIVLSALGDEVDKVLLLEIGADDYIVKPFGTRELMARVRALLRRTSTGSSKVVHFGDTELDPLRRVVKRHGEDLKLTPSEYKLLMYFVQNPDRPLTRHDPEFRIRIRLLPQYPHRGCARGQTAAETRAGAQRAAAHCDRTRSGISFPALSGGIFGGDINDKW